MAFSDFFKPKKPQLGCPPEFLQRKCKIERDDAFTVTSIGSTNLLRVTNAPIEIIEIAIQAKGLNTWQLFSGNRARSAKYEFTADQSGSLGGFVMQWPDVLSIITTTAAQLDINIRYRV